MQNPEQTALTNQAGGTNEAAGLLAALERPALEGLQVSNTGFGWLSRDRGGIPSRDEAMPPRDRGMALRDGVPSRDSAMLVRQAIHTWRDSLINLTRVESAPELQARQV